METSGPLHDPDDLPPEKTTWVWVAVWKHLPATRNCIPVSQSASPQWLRYRHSSLTQGAMCKQLSRTHAARGSCWISIGCSLCPRPQQGPRDDSPDRLGAARDGIVSGRWARMLIRQPQTPPVGHTHKHTLLESGCAVQDAVCSISVLNCFP
jgi:hypothetical protein